VFVVLFRRLRITHKAGPPTCTFIRLFTTAPELLTWPGRESDQKGTAPSVEQDHCTLIAVKRYRDPPRIGGRHNFLLRPYRSTNNLKKVVVLFNFFVSRTDR